MSDESLEQPAPPADQRLAYGSDPNQFLDLRFPKQPKSSAPLIMNIHGGFWRAKYSLEHAGHFCAALTAQGVITANIEYRRVGNDGGGWPGTFADVRSAYTYLVQNAQKLKIDVKKTVITGHSAGGQLALCLAAHEKSVTRAVSLAGVVDLQRAYQLHLSHDAVVEFLHGTPKEVPDHYREADPMELSISNARQLLIHDKSDEDVPFEFSRDYVSTKRKRTGKEAEEVQLLEILNASHMDVIDPSSHAWPKVAETILQLVAS
jgi:acetyl esterase/lipase